MTKFLVAHTLDHKELADHIAALGGLKNATVTVLPDMEQATPLTRNPPAPKVVPSPKTNGGRNRKSGGSTVNTIILSAMAGGPASTAGLKDALTAAGKKSSSLPTALIALQKSGQIERVGVGQYQMNRTPSAAE